MNAIAPGSVLYAKAKQRVLNKMGRKTSLTRNERVDYVSPRLEEIARSRKHVSSLLANFRSHYRKTLWAGTELCVELITLWSMEIGQRAYDSDTGAYYREQNNAQMLVVQEAADDIRTVMEKLEKLSAQFDTFLKREADGPFGEFRGSEAEVYDNVIRSKEAYRSVRTKYSDAVISNKVGACSERDLEVVSREFEDCTNDLELKMLQYENHWREQLFSGVSQFFAQQQGYIEQVAETLDDLQVWTSHMSLDLQGMKAQADRLRKGRQLERTFRTSAQGEIDRLNASPMYKEDLLVYRPALQEDMTPINSGSSQDEEMTEQTSEFADESEERSYGMEKVQDVERRYSDLGERTEQLEEQVRKSSGKGRQRTA